MTHHLTRSERAILERLTQGLTIKQAAGDLGCSYQSGRKHLSNAYAKLGVRTQTQAALAVVHRHQ